MRITFVLPGIGLSGGSRVVFEYANRLKARGHDVCVVYPLLPIDVTPVPAVQKARKNIGALRALYKGNRINWFDLKAKLIRVPSLSPGMASLVQGMIPDSDVIVATAWETAYAVSKLSEKKGKKLYFIQHYEVWGLWDDEGCWAEAERLNNGDDICYAMASVVPKDHGLKIYKEAVDRTYKFPFVKITISSWLKRLVSEKFCEPAEGPVINGINFNVFYPDPSAEKREKPRILMAYRSYKNKGSGDGMKALCMAKERHPEIECAMYGEKRPEGLPEWISFHEKPSDNELRRLYSDADIFVCPSWVEGFGLTPMEASACGCAVVATRVGAVPDYAVDGRTIISTPPRNPEALANGISRLIENEGERKAIADSGRAYVQQFTWDRAADDLERILKKFSGTVKK